MSWNRKSAAIWSRLLVPDCLALLAPNQRLANPIPKPGDVERILSHTKLAYATAPSLMPRKRLEQPAERLTEDANTLTRWRNNWEK